MFGLLKAMIFTFSVVSGQPATAFTAPVDFFKEEITLTVSDSQAAINGIFYFRNNTDRDRPFPIIFPFYVDSLTSYPDKINAYTINGGDTAAINFEALAGRRAIRMAVPMKPKGVTVWYLDYTQKIDSPHARYILTSTAAWKKPLEEATYYFVMPETFNVISVWPEPDSTKISGAKKILKCERKNFMPERDMEIIWEQK